MLLKRTTETKDTPLTKLETVCSTTSLGAQESTLSSEITPWWSKTESNPLKTERSSSPMP